MVIMDASQFVERYRLIYRDLYRFALCMLGNVHDAEDAVSESVATGWEKRGQLRRASAFKSWMFQIAANCCRQKLRGAKRFEVTDMNDIDAPSGQRGRAGRRLLPSARPSPRCPRPTALSCPSRVFGGYTSREIGVIANLNPGHRPLPSHAGAGKDGALFGRCPAHEVV